MKYVATDFVNEQYKSNSGNVTEYVALCQIQLIHN